MPSGTERAEILFSTPRPSTWAPTKVTYFVFQSANPKVLEFSFQRLPTTILVPCGSIVGSRPGVIRVCRRAGEVRALSSVRATPKLQEIYLSHSVASTMVASTVQRRCLLLLALLAVAGRALATEAFFVAAPSSLACRLACLAAPAYSVLAARNLAKGPDFAGT